MIELVITMFLIVLFWIIFAVIQDLKYREIANWLNFSLAIFLLAFRFFYSVFSDNYNIFLFGIIGLVIFTILGHLLYYARFFAGGDAKLFISLGAFLPFTLSWYTNFLICMVFLFGLFFLGGIYSMIYSGFLAYSKKNDFVSEFKKNFYKKEKWFFVSLVFALIFAISGFVFSEIMFFVLGGFCLLLPILFIYVSSVEKICLIKEIDADKLTSGDWLVNSIKLKDKTIEPNWEGVSEEDLDLIKKHYKKKILVKYGIPFSPAFLFAVIFLIVLYFLRYPYWIFS
ncbi:MAG TPA: prepilin peptidase [Candidatus Paceibacterota bacterium]|nr:prepilin peptidase [Candidatus Paceibacterota bacterium]